MRGVREMRPVKRRLGAATGKVRALRLGLVVGLVGMAVLVGWSMRDPAAVPPASPLRVARSAVAGERGEQCTWTQIVGEEQSVGFEAPECFTEPDGTQRLTGDERRGPARVTIRYQAHGESDTLTIKALHGRYEPQGQKARFEGAVRVSTGLGLAAEMESVSYDGIEGIAESADAVTFSRKQLSGRGRGLQFDARKGRLWLPLMLQPPACRPAAVARPTRPAWLSSLSSRSWRWGSGSWSGNEWPIAPPSLFAPFLDSRGPWTVVRGPFFLFVICVEARATGGAGRPRKA